MKGLELSALPHTLAKVPQEHAQKPANAIPDAIRKFGAWWRLMRLRHEREFALTELLHCFPLRAFENFNFDEFCKLYFSSENAMQPCVDKVFGDVPPYEVVNKIQSSMYRWGGICTDWNQIVDAYYHLRTFTFLDIPDFEIRVDHATYFNECGPGRHSYVYLDGAFGILVYYKKQHVLTIGFSFAGKGRILIQQFQARQRAGNRFLFQLPQNRLEFVIDLFAQNFPGYVLYVVDGASLVEKTRRDYARQTVAAKKLHDASARELARATSESGREYAQASIDRTVTLRRKLVTTRKHLARDKQRLILFYKGYGKYSPLQETFTCFSLTHIRIA